MRSIFLLTLSTLCVTSLRAAEPNIVVILTDDQGYADISLNPHHPKEVSTPHMDALAKEGVAFTQAYTSGDVCSPTRAGLMLGRYQQRVGVYSAGDGGRGFDPKLPIFPAFLPEAYVSTAIGKWHLGLDDDYPELKWHALNRGFDECYTFMGRGGHSYFDLRSDSAGKFTGAIYRNKERINDQGYLTDRLSEEAVAFIDRNKNRPFFLYLAYNAVHAPPEAPQRTIDAYRLRFPGIRRERVVLMAMLKHLDDGIGMVVNKLKQEKLFDNTLLFFLTDNGGAKGMHADNTPLRGFKGSLYEGGIRTPFIVSWPARFPGQRTIDTPILSLDILPTALDALGLPPPAEPPFDGKSLLPLLTGTSRGHHETLYWCKADDEWAVRQGDWKLHVDKERTELFHLAEDPSEQTNLAEQKPETAQALRSAFDAWVAPMPDPITGGRKGANPGSADENPTAREQEKLKKREERKMQREADKQAVKTGEGAIKDQAPQGLHPDMALTQDPALGVSAAPPSARFDLSHWKLTLPVDASGNTGGGAAEIPVRQLAGGYQGIYFHGDEEGSMVFWCPARGAATENTRFPRSELREMLDPGDPAVNWTMQGTHILEAECRLLQIPSYPKVVIGQIHSYSGQAKPLVKLQYYKGRMEALVKLSPTKGADRKLTFPEVALNSDISWEIRLEDGLLSITVNGTTQTENILQNDADWANQTFYFKAGAYSQDNEGPPDEGARVTFSKLQVRHTDPT